MCKICVDWEKGKMTSKEAMGAIREVIGPASGEDNEHYIKLAGKIMDKEVSSGTEQDSELDAEYERSKGGS